MSRESLYSSFMVQQNINANYLATMLDFLVRNQNLLLSPQEVQALFKTKISIMTPTSHIFQRALDLGLDHSFSVINARSHKAPDALTRSYYLTLDFSQMASISHHLPEIIKTVPSLDGNILINGTQLMRADGTLTDQQNLHGYVVRDLLSRSFYQDKRPIWLTPNIAQFVCKVYSMSLATSVAKWFNLDTLTQSSVAVVFAYYFVNLMSNPQTARVLIKSRAKALYLPEPQQLQQILDYTDDVLGGRPPANLDEVFYVIHGIAPERVQLHRGLFITGVSSLGPDVHTTAIGLEYPPYFAYMLLYALSGTRKNGLSMFIKNVQLKREALDFIEELTTSPMFLPAITQ